MFMKFFEYLIQNLFLWIDHFMASTLIQQIYSTPQVYHHESMAPDQELYAHSIYNKTYGMQSYE